MGKDPQSGGQTLIDELSQHTPTKHRKGTQ